MKIKIITILLGILGLTLLLQSASGGRAAVGEIDRTGAPGSTGTCGVYCHVSSGFHPNTQINMELKNALGGVVTSYVPEETYTLEFTVTSDGNPQGYGMQAVLLDSSGANAGIMLTTLTNNTQITTISNGRSFVEHDAINTTGVFKARWKAPVAGTGEVTIHGIGLAADGSGTLQGDDISPSAQLLLTESIVSGVKSAEKRVEVVEFFPNPNKGTFYLKNKGTSANWLITVANMQGQVMYKKKSYVEEESNYQVELETLNVGFYFVRVQSEDYSEIFKMTIN